MLRVAKEECEPYVSAQTVMLNRTCAAILSMVAVFSDTILNRRILA